MDHKVKRAIEEITMSMIDNFRESILFDKGNEIQDHFNTVTMSVLNSVCATIIYTFIDINLDTPIGSKDYQKKYLEMMEYMLSQLNKGIMSTLPQKFNDFNTNHRIH